MDSFVINIPTQSNDKYKYSDSDIDTDELHPEHTVARLSTSLTVWCGVVFVVCILYRLLYEN